VCLNKDKPLYTLPCSNRKGDVMVHLRAKKIPGKRREFLIYYYLIKDDYSNGKKIQKVVKYLGTANTLLKKMERLDELEKRNK
jgi:hypothetical protein